VVWRCSKLILDVGCGIGGSSHLARLNARATGITLSQFKLLEQLSALAEVSYKNRFQVADAQAAVLIILLI